MKTNIPGVTAVDHTVDVDGRLVAGFLVRLFGRDLGFVWTLRGVWHWASMSGRTTGERDRKAEAIQTLVDAFDRAKERAKTAPKTAPKTASTTTAPRPAQRIDWSTTRARDLAGDVAAALKKHGGAK